ncbi:YebC/PmpR family DNA-binding transcriptional regulator [Candidatus Persebacteraceae bacterium Df01]|jgi:YebC/PmpR family DNA-binding regulatory protein|uniref:Probable transcriptional regulatory protein NQX30_07020 n=1 Tax=Candidatus Doriopsillibacter californiensis TaxID=2970740 RepID=A0ABT7QN29_9GAMM|nr:YebC/PmpR family DNA-binding transcriptional regulator [Candidatus Persebacteraceae bacterium Df01]
MAGHSKWANIKHRKERMDSKRGKTFSRLVKETTIAAKVGGPDPGCNPRLRLALEKAREANVPNDNLERAIKRGSGQLEGVDYMEVRYEGYGPGGAAVIVDCLTDNKNRSLSEVRFTFNKNGGNLGTDGSVSYLFTRCGQLLFTSVEDEVALMEVAVENGAEDLQTDDNGDVEITCAATDFPTLLDAVRNANFKPEFAEVVMSPSMEVSLDDDDSAKMRRLLNALEDLDDTQQVYTSAALSEENVS